MTYSHNELFDIEMTDVVKNFPSFDKIQKLTPFPLVEELSDTFDEHLNEFAHSKYKYMLAFISAEFGTKAVEDVACNLSNCQSKYASNIWIGQEDLYGPLEEVLNILMAEPKHKCFLQRVTSKEAPDYARIIKNPMDLSRVAKNLKNSLYKTKLEFQNDINLIVDNCLLYNVDADNIYRSFSLSLRDRCHALMHDVPDIRIKHISKLTAEELKEWKSQRSSTFISKHSAPISNISRLAFDPVN
eukprot:NODE_352_length_10276_cov_0.244178.p6 type:complete len:243 gc:universal NODE_352_length_10276_cov_0.244178:4025-4753(+)